MADFNDILNMMNELYKAKPPKAPQQTAQATPSLMPQTPPPVYNVPPGCNLVE